VRQHGPGDDVADREYARHVRLELVVGDNAAAVVGYNLEAFQENGYHFEGVHFELVIYKFCSKTYRSPTQNVARSKNVFIHNFA
jgi:hypothetical protein